MYLKTKHLASEKIGTSLLLLVCLMVYGFSSQAPTGIRSIGVHAADLSVTWAMFRNNPQHTGLSAFVGPQQNTVAWTYQTGGKINSSPAVGLDGRIYVGSYDKKLYAFDPNGTVAWAFTTGDIIFSSPAVSPGGDVYVGSDDHYLYAINSDGTLDWKFQTGAAIDSSPAIGDDGTIYVGSYDHKLYAINPDGTVKCSFTAGAVIVSSPAVGQDGAVYFGSSDGVMNAINADCTKKWQSLLPHSTNGIWSSPAFSPDGAVIYYGADDGYFYATNTSDGSLKWTSPYAYGGVQASMAVGSDGTVYAGTQYGDQWAINPVDGSKKWDHYTTLEVWSSPAIGADGTIYFPTFYGNVFALNPDGTLKWNYNGGLSVAGNFMSSPAIGRDGSLYVGSDNGKFFAFNSTQLVAVPRSTGVYPGDPLVVDLNIQGANGVYAVQTTCMVNPAILQPQNGVFDSFFDLQNSFVAVNQANAAAGTWTGAISLHNPAQPVNGDGQFATINYLAKAPGTIPIDCAPIFTQRDGFELTVGYTGANVTVLSFATITGRVVAQGRAVQPAIQLSATGPVTSSATTNKAGNFTIGQLKAGSYNIQASWPRYLPSCTTASVTSGQTVNIPDSMLKGGDANGDGAVDIADATLVAANFGLNVPPADPRADINGDNTVNIKDLAMVGSNYGLSGCQGW